LVWPGSKLAGTMKLTWVGETYNSGAKIPPTTTRTPARIVGNPPPLSLADAVFVENARFEPYRLARTFGVSDVGLPFAELTTLSGGNVGGFPFPCAHKPDRKRNTASSKNAADTDLILPCRLS